MYGPAPAVPGVPVWTGVLGMRSSGVAVPGEAGRDAPTEEASNYDMIDGVSLPVVRPGGTISMGEDALTRWRNGTATGPGWGIPRQGVRRARLVGQCRMWHR